MKITVMTQSVYDSIKRLGGEPNTEVGKEIPQELGYVVSGNLFDCDGIGLGAGLVVGTNEDWFKNKKNIVWAGDIVYAMSKKDLPYSTCGLKTQESCGRMTRTKDEDLVRMFIKDKGFNPDEIGSPIRNVLLDIEGE